MKKTILFTAVLFPFFGSTQTKGTLVIDPDVPREFMIGPVYTDIMQPALWCSDTVITAGCTDSDITITHFTVMIELHREVVIEVNGNVLPDTLCQVARMLRGGEVVYITEITGTDSSGETVKIPPIRFLMRSIPGAAVRNNDYDPNDY